MAYTAEQYQAQVRRDVGDVGASAQFELIFPPSATGGTWAFVLAGEASGAIARFAPVADVQAAIEAMGLVGAGNVTVALAAHGYLVTFPVGVSVPTPSVDGALLEPEAATVAVAIKQVGTAYFLSDARIAEMWDRRDNLTNLEARYLYVLLDAIIELQGTVWQQVDQGDAERKRSYSQQFKQLAAVYARALGQLQILEQGVTPDSVTAAAQSYGGEMANVTPDGSPFPTQRRSLYYGRYGRC